MTDRDRVIEAALELLLERGWRGVTTDAVAKRARMSKKTLYRLFRSKQELLEAALEELIRRSFSRLDAILEGEGPPLDIIDRFLSEISRIIGQVQGQILEQTRGISPRLWARVEAERGKRLAAIGRLVSRAQAEGLVRPDLRIDLWLLLLRTAVEGLMNPQRVLREGLAASEMVEVLRMVLFEGILTPEGRAALRRLRRERRDG